MNLSFGLKVGLIIISVLETFSAFCGNFQCSCGLFGLSCCSDNCCLGEGTYYAYGSCKTCEPGYYCVNKGSHRAPCSEGYYNPSYGRTSCTICSAGYYCPYQGMASQTPCPAGYFCGQGSLSPTLCTPGYYCPASSTVPISCGISLLEVCSIYTTQLAVYCPAGSIRPTVCPEGNFCPDKASNYTQCPAGYYCPSGSVLPTLCPEGMYSSAGASQCLACPRGYYCPGTTRTQAIPCGKGNYCPMGASLPIPCPAGTYTSINNATECTTCTVGYYSDKGQSSCTSCSALPRIKGNYTGEINVTTHWTGGPLASQCNCEIGWFGTNCEMRNYTSNYFNESESSIMLMTNYTSLNVTKDTNATKNITIF